MRRPLPLLAAVLLTIFGCDQRSPAPVGYVNPAPPQIVAQTAVSPQDFALANVVALLRSGVTDGQSLEASINNPSTGINNVDMDKDGRVDYVMVRESPTPTGKRMDLVDHPSSGAGADQPIASISFDQGPAGVNVQAGYAPFIDPSGSLYYRDTMPSNLAFATWLFLASRPAYYAPVPIGYAYRSTLAPSVVSQTRTTYETQTKVSPVRTSPKPASFTTGITSKPQATVVQGSGPKASTGTLSGNAAGLSDFKVSSGPKPAAAGFASPATRPAAPAPAPAARPSPVSVSRPSSPPSSPSRTTSSVSVGRKK